MSERRPDYMALVGQEQERRAGLEEARTTADSILNLIKGRFARKGESMPAEDIASLSAALYSCAETLAIVATVQAGMPVHLH